MSHYSPSQKHRIFKNKNLIIFDFDGVLADSFDTFYPLIRDAMKKIGILLSKKSYRELFNGNVHKEFEKLISDKKKYETFSKFRADNYNKYYKRCPPRLFPRAKQLLKNLSRSYVLTIASSGKKYNILWLLKKSMSNKHFDFILATTDQTKEIMLREIMKKHRADPKQTIMITDTIGDVKIAKKLGLKTIAVSWGFQSYKTLKTSKPNKLLKRVSELEKVLIQ